MDIEIEYTLGFWIISKTILIWAPGLIAAINILWRRNERWRFRGLSIGIITGLSLDMAFFLLAFIQSNLGQGAEGS